MPTLTEARKDGELLRSPRCSFCGKTLFAGAYCQSPGELSPIVYHCGEQACVIETIHWMIDARTDRDEWFKRKREAYRREDEALGLEIN